MVRSSGSPPPARHRTPKVPGSCTPSTSTPTTGAAAPAGPCSEPPRRSWTGWASPSRCCGSCPATPAPAASTSEPGGPPTAPRRPARPLGSASTRSATGGARPARRSRRRPRRDRVAGLVVDLLQVVTDDLHDGAGAAVLSGPCPLLAPAHDHHPAALGQGLAGVLGRVASHQDGDERRLLLPPARHRHPEHRPSDPGPGGADPGVLGQVAGEAHRGLGHGPALLDWLAGR